MVGLPSVWDIYALQVVKGSRRRKNGYKANRFAFLYSHKKLFAVLLGPAGFTPVGHFHHILNREHIFAAYLLTIAACCRHLLDTAGCDVQAFGHHPGWDQFRFHFGYIHGPLLSMKSSMAIPAQRRQIGRALAEQPSISPGRVMHLNGHIVAEGAQTSLL